MKSKATPDGEQTPAQSPDRDSKKKRKTPCPPPIGRHRRAELSRRTQVLNGTRKPFDPKADGKSLAPLRLSHVKKSVRVDASHFSTRNDAQRSKPGFIGIRDRGDREPAANPTTKASEPSIPITPEMPPLLQKLLKAGYQYIPSDIK